MKIVIYIVSFVYGFFLYIPGYLDRVIFCDVRKECLCVCVSVCEIFPNLAITYIYFVLILYLNNVC